MIRLMLYSIKFDVSRYCNIRFYLRSCYGKKYKNDIRNKNYLTLKNLEVYSESLNARTKQTQLTDQNLGKRFSRIL